MELIEIASLIKKVQEIFIRIKVGRQKVIKKGSEGLKINPL